MKRRCSQSKPGSEAEDNGNVLCVDTEAVVLSFDQASDYEWRVSYGEAAALVSALQQGGWDAVDEAYDAIVEAGLDLDF